MNNKKEKLIIYGLYSHYIEEIKHFEVIQTSLRLLSSTLLLFSFTALGFFLSLDISELPVQKTIPLIIIYGVFLSLIIAISRLDTVFYERLLTCHFIEALRLENENEWLPKVHQNILKNNYTKNSPKDVCFFYWGSALTFSLTIGCVLAHFFYQDHPLFSWGILMFTAVIIIYLYFLLDKKVEKLNDLIKELSHVS